MYIYQVHYTSFLAVLTNSDFQYEAYLHNVRFVYARARVRAHAQSGQTSTSIARRCESALAVLELGLSIRSLAVYHASVACDQTVTRALEGKDILHLVIDTCHSLVCKNVRRVVFNTLYA